MTNRPRLNALASAVGLLAVGLSSAQAQQAAAPQAEPQQLETVIVTGIRKSLDSSLDMKRKAQGVVDGIVAEDIGKFPDSNLAESMQRIAGVSIDRTANGEGSKVTVRGVGPDFNLVLLNGRQMPASSIGDTYASNSRAFDFANLASESIAALEVYKTSRAETPTGGIGATINIKTARPLEAGKQIASFGMKLVSDQSNKRLPDPTKGSQLTPEVSGIYSDVFADGTFGIALSASHQKRNSGFNQVGVNAGWHNNTGGSGQVSQALQDASGIQQGDLYVVPQELRYSLNGLQRTRTNGQLVLQYRPVKDLTATLDATYSELKIHTRRNELSAWFNTSPTSGTWENDGSGVFAPSTYGETYGNPADVAMAGGVFGTKARNQATGFNLAWQASKDLKLEFDAHHATATTGADSPYGSNATIGVSMYNRANITADFRHGFPVLGIGIAGNPGDGPALTQVTGSSFRNSYMRNAIDQAQFKGKFNLSESSELDFGVSLSKVKNRTAFANVQQDNWGGYGKTSDYDDGLWQAASLRPYFARSLSASGADGAALFNDFYLWDFDAVRKAAIAVNGDTATFSPSSNFTDDRRTQETSRSAYVQYQTDWESWGIPMNASAGLRYESTKVRSQALVPVVTGLEWKSENEFAIIRGDAAFLAGTGKYSYVLPSIDWSADLTSQLKVRASYGETIGRPGWGDIQSGTTLNDFRVGGGTGSSGNPNLKPLKSKNIDFSAEYYYAKGSYAALGLFRKNISNFIGTNGVQTSPFNLTTPVGGALYNQALAATGGNCGTADRVCIRNYILHTYDGTNGVVWTGDDVKGANGTIAGQPGDPAAVFTVSTPVNARKDHINGVELNVQHAFGNSGFGMSANYTWVRSGLKYQNASLAQQYALLGLSNSANAVGFYEDDSFSVRLAYNWRDAFLSGTNSDIWGSAGPSYTAAYGQWDLSAGYKFNRNLSVQVEAINMNDGTQRVYGRNKQQTQYYTQTGRRFMIGARYTF
ncbi:MAG: TonB-dependent receptor [Roseateles sp.]|uniref:TonB-dependent receptor n=1 Tax=Roseateles sp. TaxID=1971397 RepID=UPI0039EA4C7F